MAQRLEIHLQNPQPRLLQQVAEILQKDGVIAYPTDSAYALGCMIGAKHAEERIRRIRHLDKNHNFTLICRDLSDISQYANISTPTFRLLKAYTPGPYTFILEASREVPKRLQHPKHKTIGIRIPDHIIAQAILAELQQPLMSVTLMKLDSLESFADPDEIAGELGHQIDMLVDAGPCGLEPTTVVDLTTGAPRLIRIGKGDPTPFE